MQISLFMTVHMQKYIQFESEYKYNVNVSVQVKCSVTNRFARKQNFVRFIRYANDKIIDESI